MCLWFRTFIAASRNVYKCGTSMDSPPAAELKPAQGQPLGNQMSRSDDQTNVYI